MGMAANEGKPTGKTAPTYLELREELLRRDRSLRHKVVAKDLLARAASSPATATCCMRQASAITW